MPTIHILNELDTLLKFYDTSWDTNSQNLLESKEFIPTLTKYNENVRAKFDDDTNVWGMSYEIAAETFGYIYRLKTKVYIAKVNDGIFTDFIYFDPKGFSPEFKPFLNRIDNRLKWKKEDKNLLLKTQWKFMNCVLQDKKEKDDPIEKRPYYTLLTSIHPDVWKHVKNGLYIFSVRDLLLVRKDRKEPWIDLVGEKFHKTDKSIGFIPKKFLPIFNSTGSKDYFDIPIPPYDDWSYIRSFSYDPLGDPKFRNLNLDWNTKKDIAVFRGSATGCGYNAFNNTRIRLAKLANKFPEYLDAGITREPTKKKFIANRKTGIGYFDMSGIGLSVVNRLSKEEQSNYKYVLYVEGNVSAHRLATDMLMGSVILFVETEYTLWFEHLLVEYQHYISVKKDLSDLIEKIKWCRENDDICQSIATNCRKFALDILQRDVLLNSVGNMIQNVLN
jgi:hypothetical protein